MTGAPTKPLKQTTSSKTQSGKHSKPRNTDVTEPAIPAVIVGHGYKDRFLSGKIVMDPEAKEPNNPNAPISRAKVSSGYDQLHSRDQISDLQREAADRYAIENERAGGRSRISDPTRLPNHEAFWNRSSGDAGQSAAAHSVAGVEAAIGLQGTIVMRLYVVQDMNLGVIAQRFGVNAHVVKGWITAYLTIMVEHWNLGRKVVGPKSKMRSI